MQKPTFPFWERRGSYMRVYDEIQDFCLKNTVVTLGKFDGIHLGHQKLVTEIAESRLRDGYETVLFSFDTSGINNQMSITTKKERILLCEEAGIDNVIFYPVNKSTMAIKAEDFIKDVIADRLGAKVVVTGRDFCFGSERRGNVGMLNSYAEIYGYRLVVVDSVLYQGKKVSSSNIKECIGQGKIEEANRMLGYSYFIYGNVVKGNQIGRTMNTKTVNVIPDKQKILMPNGVYKTKAVIGGETYKSITNVGLCPTVRSDRKITVETHIFDFDREIYDSDVKIEFEKFIREERKFSTLEELKRQILLDISQANL